PRPMRASVLLSLRCSLRLLLFRFFDCGGHDLRVAPEPVGLLAELAVMHLEDLPPAAAFMVGRRYLQRRDETAQSEIVDLFEPILYVGSGGAVPPWGFDRIADRLDVDCRI